ncbi:hypothetical protein LPJ66_008914, partial [Kickxella alabastrina]
MQSGVYHKRLMSELRQIQSSTLSNVHLKTYEGLDIWIITIHGAEKTLYAGEEFTLRLKFPSNYPFEAPEAIFVGKVPVHPHVYSNGHICLSILYQQWSPALTAQTLCLSILSMLSSCVTKERPTGDLNYVAVARSPKDAIWNFD